jgi:hypothetical protein
MPKTPNEATTVEAMAAASFEVLPAADLTPPPTLAAFMESAGGAFNVVRLGFAMLAKTPDELVEAFGSLGEDEVLRFASDVSGTKEWIAGLTRVLEAIEARTWIAACRLAVEG